MELVDTNEFWICLRGTPEEATRLVTAFKPCNGDSDSRSSGWRQTVGRILLSFGEGNRDGVAIDAHSFRPGEVALRRPILVHEISGQGGHYSRGLMSREIKRPDNLKVCRMLLGQVLETEGFVDAPTAKTIAETPDVKVPASYHSVARELPRKPSAVSPEQAGL